MKELKLRFRSFKSFSGLMFYLATLAIFVTGFVLVATNFSSPGFLNPNTSYLLFISLTIVQMALVMFITPGVTAGVISGEREKQTLNILLTTTQTSTQIIIGKLLSSIAFLLLMLVAGLPIYSLVFLFGGVSPLQIIIIFLFYVVTLITIGSIGIFFSTITKRTAVAMISTYGTMIFLGAITALFFGVGSMMNEVIFNGSHFTPVTYFWASINPGALMLTIASPELAGALTELTGIAVPVWVTYLLVYTAITIFCLTTAIRKLRVNMKNSR